MSSIRLIFTALLTLAVVGTAHARPDRMAMNRLLQTLPASRQAESQRLCLSDMLAAMKQAYARPEISGRFHDWRAVSVYRRQAGLHYGYDIAMPAGTRVPAAWSGKVVAITPWYGTEHGITVQTGNALTTYGHLSPLLAVGDLVQAGQAVGTICVDHVDVKMRDLAGNHVDFGEGAGDLVPPASPDQCLAEWLQASIDVVTVEDDLRALDPAPIRLLLREQMGRRARLEARVGSMQTLLAEGAVSPREVSQACSDHTRVINEIAHLEMQLENVRPRGPELRARLERARQRRDTLWQACRRSGLSERSVTLRLARHAETPPRVGAIHVADWEAPEGERSARLRRMHEDGIISAREWERLLAEPARDAVAR